MLTEGTHPEEGRAGPVDQTTCRLAPACSDGVLLAVQIGDHALVDEPSRHLGQRQGAALEVIRRLDPLDRRLRDAKLCWPAPKRLGGTAPQAPETLAPPDEGHKYSRLPVIAGINLIEIAHG